MNRLQKAIAKNQGRPILGAAAYMSPAISLLLRGPTPRHALGLEHDGGGGPSHLDVLVVEIDFQVDSSR